MLPLSVGMPALADAMLPPPGQQRMVLIASLDMVSSLACQAPMAPTTDRSTNTVSICKRLRASVCSGHADTKEDKLPES